MYFGDDDNTYDLRLFDEIRDTRHISMFPVGLVGDYAVSSPVVHEVIKENCLFILSDNNFGFIREKWLDFTILGRQDVDMQLIWLVLLSMLSYCTDIQMLQSYTKQVMKKISFYKPFFPILIVRLNPKQLIALR